MKVSFAMLDMEMGEQSTGMTEVRPGVYRHAAPALVMVGHWGLQFEVDPAGRRAVHRVLRRPGERMIWLRLGAAGRRRPAPASARVVVVILLLRDALA